MDRARNRLVRILYSAWQERVLDAEPKIPFLHITDIRDPDWCKEHGMTWDQAQDRMDEAALVINRMGSLYPITTNTKRRRLEHIGRPELAKYLWRVNSCW